MQLYKNYLNYLGSIDLTQYYVQSHKITDTENFTLSSTNEQNGVKVDIILKRRLLNQILTIFLPTTCICICAFSTSFYMVIHLEYKTTFSSQKRLFFFQPNVFNAIVTVNLSSLLILTTLFIGISNSLPRTSYVKLIDVWMIFCLMMPFADVILHTLLGILRKLNEDRRAREGSRTNQAWQKEEAKGTNDYSHLCSGLEAFGRFGLPSVFVAFAAVFFGYGLLIQSQKVEGIADSF